MAVKREPHQILVFEHLLCFLVGSAFLFLCLAFVSQAALKLTELPAEDIARATIGAALFITLLICHLLMPYSCFRLWVSAGNNTEGFKKVL